MIGSCSRINVVCSRLNWQSHDCGMSTVILYANRIIWYKDSCILIGYYHILASLVPNFSPMCDAWDSLYPSLDMFLWFFCHFRCLRWHSLSDYRCSWMVENGHVCCCFPYFVCGCQKVIGANDHSVFGSFHKLLPMHTLECREGSRVYVIIRYRVGSGELCSAVTKRRAATKLPCELFFFIDD